MYVYIYRHILLVFYLRIISLKVRFLLTLQSRKAQEMTPQGLD